MGSVTSVAIGAGVKGGWSVHPCGGRVLIDWKVVNLHVGRVSTHRPSIDAPVCGCVARLSTDSYENEILWVPENVKPETVGRGTGAYRGSN